MGEKEIIKGNYLEITGSDFGLSSNEVVISLDDFEVIFNLENGKFIEIEESSLLNKSELKKFLSKVGFYDSIGEVKISNNDIHMLFPTVEINKKCNLACKYCFINSNERSNNEIKIEDTVDFIKILKNKFNDIRHINIDFTGSGEPLLSYKKIQKIIDRIDDDFEFNSCTYSFCSNGTIYSKEIKKFIKNNKIHFGISIDGTQKIHDKYRVKADNSKTHSLIMDNKKKYSKKTYGAAVSYALDNPLSESFQFLSNEFDNIAMKPIRYDNNDWNVNNLLVEYEKIYDYLCKETYRNNFNPLKAIMSDEDLFGKFIRRVFLYQINAVRCGASVSKYALSLDKSIYICGAAIGYDEFKIGNLIEGINDSKVEIIRNKLLQKSKCKHCWAKSICAGPCLVNNYQISKNYDMLPENICLLSKSLITKALRLKYYLYKNKPKIYKKVMEISRDNHYK
ncbi:MAG: SPASM domain-containing protein [Acholeplasmataceae bacterium]